MSERPDTLDQIILALPNDGGAIAQGIRVITVRMPAELHADLKREAHERKTSVNKLAVAKLCIRGSVLDMVAARLLPPAC